MASVLALLKCHIFLRKLGGGGILKLSLQKVIWCFTVGSREGRTPLLRTKFGWSAKIMSIHEGLQSSRKSELVHLLAGVNWICKAGTMQAQCSSSAGKMQAQIRCNSEKFLKLLCFFWPSFIRNQGGSWCTIVSLVWYSRIYQFIWVFEVKKCQ